MLANGRWDLSLTFKGLKILIRVNCKQCKCALISCSCKTKPVIFRSIQRKVTHMNGTDIYFRHFSTPHSYIFGSAQCQVHKIYGNKKKYLSQ